ncbi:MAG: PASTA domain-containing protein [Pseudonocardiaceae bacterium]
MALFWDEVELSPRADLTEDGTFTTSFGVPASAGPGTHVVVSRCAGSEAARILASATFTVTAPPEVMVVVPNLVGSPPRDAPAALQREGLVLGRVSGSGDVIDSQNPAAGTEVRRGSRVNITLVRSASPEELVEVPNLVNRTVDEAREALAAAGLVLGNNPAGDRRVLGQTPAAGVRVARGTPVTVTVSEVPVPPSPGGPTAGGTAANPGGTPTGQPPATTQPTSPTSSTPVSPPVKPAAGFPWSLLVVLVLILLGALGGTLARQVRKGPAWVHSHVRAVAGFVPHIGVAIAESRVDPSSRTCVVRITPHHDSGTQVLEVADQ